MNFSFRDVWRTFVIATALFAMYFGAGNLILAPYIGANAGRDVLWVLAGFFISGVGLPMLALIALCLVGSPATISMHISPIFSKIFTLLVFLTLGPCMIVPRTAACAYEMTKPLMQGLIAPLSVVCTAACSLVGQSQVAATHIDVLVSAFMLILFSALFFAIAYSCAVHPGSLTNIMGKISGPCLLILMLTLIGSFFFQRPSTPPQIVNSFSAFSQQHVIVEHSNALESGLYSFAQGFICGYQTMDVFGAFIFGSILIPYIKEQGITKQEDVVRQVIKSGCIAGVLMMCIYAGFAFVGRCMSGTAQHFDQGASIIASAAAFQFGSWGSLIVAAIFTIACLNVCMTLSCAAGEYFAKTSEGPRFRWALRAVCFVSFVLANVGLSAILSYSVQILTIMYPLAVCIIAMALITSYTKKKRATLPDDTWLPYQIACLVCALETSIVVIRDMFFTTVTLPFDFVPLADLHLEWTIITLLAFICTYVFQQARAYVRRSTL